jgi:oligoribonuclease NrnB/cAMP/cGMP phosphodiesterase (DHH superfamily)
MCWFCAQEFKNKLTLLERINALDELVDTEKDFDLWNHYVELFIQASEEKVTAELFLGEKLP